MKNIIYYDSEIGILSIVDEDGALTGVSFGKKNIEDAKINETPLLKETVKQLDEYFQGKRKTFDIKMNSKGTEFQKKVWKALLTVPWGKTATYKDIAKLCGNENASRAVGMANNKNPIAIICPCHRIIGSNGALVGYAGGLDIKTRLLELEKGN